MRKIVLSIALAALSPPAFGQTTEAGPVVSVHMRRVGPVSDASMKDVRNVTAIANKAAAPAASRSASSVWAQVPRYKKTLVATQVAVYQNSCAFYSAGTITFPMQPTYGKATTETVACTVPPGQACAGRSYGTCAGIYYERTEHNNKSARSPSPEGPVDIFTYKWDVPPYISESHSPDIAVAVVRPIGETNEWQGWVAGSGEGKWLPKLMPPGDDPSFDFAGEKVKEVHLIRSTTCTPRTGGTMGTPGQPGSVRPTTEARWTVVDDNKFNEPDGVGWQPCAVQFYRCTKAVPCTYTVKQSMQIKSPADADFTEYTINILKGGIGIPIGLPSDQNALLGLVSSVRGTSGKQSHPLKTDRNSCSAFPNASFPC